MVEYYLNLLKFYINNIIKVLSYICENYFNSKTKDIFNSNPKCVDLTEYILYKTPEILIKTKSINEIIINDNYPIDDKLILCKNIKFVTVNTKNKKSFNNYIITHPIANLQNIYSLNHIGIANICNYIYENNFLMRYIYKNLPYGITHVNILHDYRFRMSFDELPINFPLSVIQIRINIILVKESIKYCADICNNLPINLEKLIICHCDYSRTYYYTENFDFEKELQNNIKLPFGCKVIMENFDY